MELQENYEFDYKTTAFLPPIPQKNVDITPEEDRIDPLESLMQQMSEGEEMKTSNSSSASSDSSSSSDSNMQPLTNTEFISQYVHDHHITTSYRWTSDRSNQLEQSAIDNNINDTTDLLTQRIKAYVGKSKP
jgi:hypothetical protein